jgi:hypothetical protein
MRESPVVFGRLALLAVIGFCPSGLGRGDENCADMESLHAGWHMHDGQGYFLLDTEYPYIGPIEPPTINGPTETILDSKSVYNYLCVTAPVSYTLQTERRHWYELSGEYAAGVDIGGTQGIDVVLIGQITEAARAQVTYNGTWANSRTVGGELHVGPIPLGPCDGIRFRAVTGRYVASSSVVTAETAIVCCRTDLCGVDGTAVTLCNPRSLAGVSEGDAIRQGGDLVEIQPLPRLNPCRACCADNDALFESLRVPLEDPEVANQLWLHWLRFLPPCWNNP